MMSWMTMMFFFVWSNWDNFFMIDNWLGIQGLCVDAIFFWSFDEEHCLLSFVFYFVVAVMIFLCFSKSTMVSMYKVPTYLILHRVLTFCFTTWSWISDFFSKMSQRRSSRRGGGDPTPKEDVAVEKPGWKLLCCSHGQLLSQWAPEPAPDWLFTLV